LKFLSLYNRATLKPAAALLLITIVAYLPALRAGWIWDDNYYVTKNYNLHDVRGLKNIWTKFGLSKGGTPQYYPVTHTTFWVEHHLWGTSPAGYHAVNVLLHAANAILIWVILRKLQVPGAWVAAAVFAVHPVHVESVAWVTERKNTLSGLFYLAAVYVYLFHVAWASRPSEFSSEESSGGTPKPQWGWYALSLALFVCALLSKSVTASLPAAILLVIWWRRGRITLRDVTPLVPMFALGIAMGWLTSWMERTQVGAQGVEWHLSFLQRVLIAGRAVWFYAMKLIAPVQLAFIYPRWQVDPARRPQWLFPIAAFALVVVAWSMRKRWGRGPTVAILFFGGTLLPALGFVDLLPMRYSFVADHFQYLASIGLIALICAAGAIYLRGALKPAAVVVLAVLAALTFRQTFIYANLETLWRDTIAKNPTGWMPRNNLANLLMEQGKLDDAERELTVALAHYPDQPEVLLNLGAVAERRERKEEAFDLYQRSARQRESGAALTNMGRLLFEAGRVDEAADLYRRAIEVEPTYARAHRLLGLALVQRDDVRGAAEAFRRATELDPSSADGWNNLGVALEKLGDARGAINAYERALQVNPAFEQAKQNLARARLVR